jgi:hypothetical protein
MFNRALLGNTSYWEIYWAWRKNPPQQRTFSVFLPGGNRNIRYILNRGSSYISYLFLFILFINIIYYIHNLILLLLLAILFYSIIFNFSLFLQLTAIASYNRKYVLLLFAGNVLLLSSTCCNTVDMDSQNIMNNQIDTMVILILIFVKGHLSWRTFYPSGRFVPPDVWSPDVLFHRTFCPEGRFVLPDVFSDGRIVWRTLGRRTFLRRMFCPSGHFVAGRFVWAPKNAWGIKQEKKNKLFHSYMYIKTS